MLEKMNEEDEKNQKNKLFVIDDGNSEWEK